MFEYKIQEAWENYKDDYGLGRITLYICFYNTFLFFLGGFQYGDYRLLPIYPVGVALVFYLLRPQLINKGSLLLFVMNVIPMAVTVVLNYYMVGEIDRMAGGLGRLDQPFWDFDLWLFGMPAASFMYKLIAPMGLFGTLLYDLMMLCYILYFLLPFYAGILYYRSLPRHKRYKLGRFFSSVIIYFSLNYLFYLMVPVTGPQFYKREAFMGPLPLSAFGQFLYSLVKNGQTTFIDCFPSGHTGIGLLSGYWLHKIHHRQRFVVYVIVGFIIGATLSMRYHYVLDLLAAFPFAFLCYKLAWILFPVEVTPTRFRRGES